MKMFISGHAEGDSLVCVPQCPMGRRALLIRHLLKGLVACAMIGACSPTSKPRGWIHPVYNVGETVVVTARFNGKASSDTRGHVATGYTFAVTAPQRLAGQRIWFSEFWDDVEFGRLKTGDLYVLTVPPTWIGSELPACDWGLRIEHLAIEADRDVRNH
jgi:hypothetical protein